MAVIESQWSWPQPFELVEHTADIGVRVSGRSSAEALARLILAHAHLVAGGVRPYGDESLELQIDIGADQSLAAVDVLREVNRLFAVRRLIAHRVAVLELTPTRVRVELRCGRYDPTLHADGLEIKAVTFHRAIFETSGGTCVAQVIFDI